MPRTIQFGGDNLSPELLSTKEQIEAKLTASFGQKVTLRYFTPPPKVINESRQDVRQDEIHL